MVRRRLDDGVGGVEVAMRKVIPHPGDVKPRDIGLLLENLGRGRSYSFTDLDQADAHGVEHHSAVECASTNVLADGLDRGWDVFESLMIATAHNGIASARICSRIADLKRGTVLSHPRHS